MPNSLVEAFARQAAQGPARLFLHDHDSGRVLSYGETQSQVAAAAALFRRRGVGRGARVAILLENGPEWVSSFLAAQAIGAIAVPLNTRLTEGELSSYIDDCDPTVVVVDERVDALVRRGDPRVVTCSELGAGPRPDVSPVAGPDDAAVIAYTSGTTGAPKGVVLSHRAVHLSSATYAAIFNSDPGFATAVAVPLFHNTGFVDGLGHAIVAGGSVELFRRFDPAIIAGGLSRGTYSFFIGVPTMYRRMLEYLGAAGERSTTYPLWLAYGGAPMPATVAEQLSRHLPDARLVNCYGMSEATSITHYLPAHLSHGRWEAVGIPVPGTADRINEHDELEVSSPTAMLGYWGGGRAGGGSGNGDWLCTGDCATRDELGLVRITGRIDELINRGGEKVAPAEVEAAICRLEGVLDVAVVGVPDPDLGQVPAALVVAGAFAFDGESVRAALVGRLADYKIPTYVHLVADLPRNANGKVVRSAVRAMIAEHLAPGSQARQPRRDVPGRGRTASIE
jgi:long-chain acyl-CoA synthetase